MTDYHNLKESTGMCLSERLAGIWLMFALPFFAASCVFPPLFIVWIPVTLLALRELDLI